MGDGEGRGRGEALGLGGVRNDVATSTLGRSRRVPSSAIAEIEEIRCFGLIRPISASISMIQISI